MGNYVRGTQLNGTVLSKESVSLCFCPCQFMVQNIANVKTGGEFWNLCCSGFQVLQKWKCTIRTKYVFLEREFDCLFFTQQFLLIYQTKRVSKMKTATAQTKSWWKRLSQKVC